MKLDLLLSPLSDVENSGLDSFDPRLTDIVELIEGANYLEAAEKSIELIEQEKIYDIRTISYYLYGIFLDQGPIGFQTIVASMKLLFGESFVAVGPAKNKEKLFFNSIKWLSAQVVKKATYEQKNNSELWTTWLKSDRVQIEQTITAFGELNEQTSVLGDKFTKKTNDLLNNLSKWLGEFVNSLSVKVEEPVKLEEPEELQPNENQNSTGPQTPKLVKNSSNNGLPPLPDSYTVKKLKKSMNVFQQLIERKQFKLAAVASTQIDKMLVNFKAQQELPEIFSPFLQNYAIYINHIINANDSKIEAQYDYHKKLYNIDLHSFVGVDLNKPSFESLEDLLSLTRLESYEEGYNAATSGSPRKLESVDIAYGSTSHEKITASQGEEITVSQNEEVTTTEDEELEVNSKVDSNEESQENESNKDSSQIQDNLSLDDFGGDEEVFRMYKELL
jgi:hypothetical protein